MWLVARRSARFDTACTVAGNGMSRGCKEMVIPSASAAYHVSVATRDEDAVLDTMTPPTDATSATAKAAARPAAQVDAPDIDLGDSSLYVHRELSQLQFNIRVLDQALDESKPLIERLKFLLIFSSNMDEFFEIRVAGL